MSLSSILASIGDSSEQPSPSPGRNPPPAIPKRKAEDELIAGAVKRVPAPPATKHGGAKRTASTAVAPGVVKPITKPPVLSAVADYKGSARTITSTPPVKRLDQKLQLSTKLPPKANSVEPKATPKNTATPTTPTTNAAPKPNSMAARLAAAKARQQAQQAQPVLGFTHKKTENVSKRERTKSKDLVTRVKKPQSGRSRTVSREASHGPADKEKKKRVEKIEYKGSVKSTMPAYNGSLGAAKAQSKSGGAKNDGYASWSDLSAAEDEEDDYGSDGSSDMEAGAFDVEREEQLALLAAKKDDAKELAFEEKRRMEKQARLARLAAGAGKKKNGY